MAKRRRRLKRPDIKRAALLLAVVLVVGAIALFVKAYQKSSPTAPPVAGIDNTGPGASGSAGVGGTGAGSTSPGSASVLQNFPTQLTSKLGRDFSGLPGHTVVLTVTSTGTIARLGYLVPTADSNQYGDRKGVAHYWSNTFTARGTTGPYGAIFIQTDRTGTPVHCTVTVDGVSKDSQTLSGRFKQGLCYG